MASNGIFPTRPSNDKDFKIDKRAKDCLTYFVLTGCKTAEAFALFYPEYNSTATDKFFVLNERGQGRCQQFFANSDNKSYINSYKGTLRAVVDGRISASEEVGEITEERKENALKSLLNKAICLVEGKADLDADTLKDITDIFRKLRLIADENTEEEVPRRYLAETCSRCAYKQFIDEQVKLGNIEQTDDDNNK